MLAAFIFRSPSAGEVMHCISASADKTALNLRLEFSILNYCLQMGKYLT